MNNNIKYSPTDSRDGTIVKNKYNILDIIDSYENTRQIHIKNYDTDIKGLLKKDFVNLTFDSQDFTYGTIKTITNKSLELLGLRYSNGIFYHGLIKLTKENLILSGGEKYLSSKDITNLTELINNNKVEIQKTKKEILNNKKEIDINKDATNTNKNKINVNQFNIDKNKKNIDKNTNDIKKFRYPKIVEIIAPVKYPDTANFDGENGIVITQYALSYPHTFFPRGTWVINTRTIKDGKTFRLTGMSNQSQWDTICEIEFKSPNKYVLHPYENQFFFGVSKIE